MSPRRSSRHAQCSPVLHSCRDEHLLATHERPALRAASATAGDVAVPNELPAAAEAPYPRVARLFAPAPRCSCWHGCRAGACARRWPRAAASRLTQQSRRDCPNGDKGGVSLGLRAGSSLRTEPMVPLLRLAPPAVCRAPARLECLAGRRSSRWTCIRDRGSGPTRAPPGRGLRTGQERAVGTLLIRARLALRPCRRIAAASHRVGRLGQARCWCTSRSWCRSARTRPAARRW